MSVGAAAASPSCGQGRCSSSSRRGGSLRICHKPDCIQNGVAVPTEAIPPTVVNKMRLNRKNKGTSMFQDASRLDPLYGKLVPHRP